MTAATTSKPVAAAGGAQAPAKKLRIMVSSSVYGNTDLLDQVYAMLMGLGYEVWMSHKGTMPVYPGLSNFENCLKAVEDCDFFFGIITPNYGSGKEVKGGISITHKEVERAVALDKPRHFVCQSFLMTARTLLNDLSFGTTSFKGRRGRKTLTLKKGAAVVNDLKVFNILEIALCEKLRPKSRKTNWVQPYTNAQDIMTFLTVQFPSPADTQTKIDLHNTLKAAANAKKAARSAKAAAKKSAAATGTPSVFGGPAAGVGGAQDV